VIVDTPEAPWATVRTEGAAPREKPGGAAITLRLILALAVFGPSVPVIIRDGFPGVAELLAVSVSILVPVVGFGMNDAVKPLGRLDVDNVTLPANPVRGVTVIVDCREVPWIIPTEVTEELMVKVGTTTVRTNVVLTTFEPQVPVTVTL
jgi:hypothetical protein